MPHAEHRYRARGCCSITVELLGRYLPSRRAVRRTFYSLWSRNVPQGDREPDVIQQSELKYLVRELSGSRRLQWNMLAKETISLSRFQAFAVVCMSNYSFWVIARRIVFIGRRCGTPTRLKQDTWKIMVATLKYDLRNQFPARAGAFLCSTIAKPSLGFTKPQIWIGLPSFV